MTPEGGRAAASPGRLRRAGALRPGALLLFAVLASPRARGDTVEVRLVFEGRDVTDERPARIELQPVRLAGSAASTIVCAPGRCCEMGVGMFVVRLKSEAWVERLRPTLMVPRYDPTSHRVLELPVAPAARLEADPAEIPVDATLDVLSVASGLLFRARVGPDAASMIVPSGPLVVGVRDAALAPLGFVRLEAKAGERIRLRRPTAPPKGRGQLFVGLQLPTVGNGIGPEPSAISCAFESGGRSAAPDVWVSGEGGKWFGFWLDVPAASGRLRVDSDSWTTPPNVDVRVPSGGVGSLPSVLLIPKNGS